MFRRKHIFFTDWVMAGKLFLVALLMDIVIWAAVTYNYWGEVSFSSFDALMGHARNLLIYIVNSIVSTFAAIKFTDFLLAAFKGKRTLSVLILRSFAILALILLTSTALSLIYVKLHVEKEWEGILTGLSVSLISFFISQIYAMGKYFKYYVNLQQQRMLSELTSRRVRTDNHFIYNCFNQLSALVVTDKEGARDFVSSLSRHYRYITAKSSDTLASVTEEVDFLEDYLILMSHRFDGKFGCEISDDVRECKASIPVLTLQILVENVFNHNAMSVEAPVHIGIYMPDSGHIAVRNDLHPISEDIYLSTEVGLKNISEQYLLLGKEIQIKKTERHFTVTIPILQS